MAIGGGSVPFRTYSTSELLRRFGYLAQTSKFRAVIQTGKSSLSFINQYNPSGGRFYEDLSILCHSASLPGSSFSTTENGQDYYGVNQKFAYRRDFDDLTLDFYVDARYSMLKFFEQWMDYISSPQNTFSTVGTDRKNNNSVYRFQYPSNYKTIIDLHKFDKDYDYVPGSSQTGTKYDILYTFVDAFPRSISSIPITYDTTDILKCSVTFSYDRYFVNRVVSPIQSDVASQNQVSTNTSAVAGGITPFTTKNLPTVITNEYYNNFGDRRQDATNSVNFLGPDIG